MNKHKDMVGMKVNRVSVLRREKNDKHGCARWFCRCDCGTKFITLGASLRNGNTKSCGCIQKEKASLIGERTRTHGKTETTEYKIWEAMKRRCNKPTDRQYKNYGGRGIKVCKRWENSFSNFISDMGERPKGMTIERINNNKGYSPNNCRWATWKEQQNNRRNNRYITMDGETHTLSQWQDILGIGRHKILQSVENRCET